MLRFDSCSFVSFVSNFAGASRALVADSGIRPFTRHVVGIFLTALCTGDRARHELLRVCTNPHSVDASHPREADVRFAGPPHIAYRNLPLVGRRDESFQDHSRVTNTILDVAPSATVSTLIRGRPPPNTGRYPAN